MTKKPKLSFIVTARNDDYGGNWTNRISTFLKGIAHGAEKNETECEIVFVEYNPVENKVSIAQDLTIPQNPFFYVRFITVPKEFHNKLLGHERITVCEFIAKNIGIKRAWGEFIIATNPDVIYSEELMEFLCKTDLLKDHFYRINRKDLSINKFNLHDSTEKILKIAQKNVARVLYNNQTKYVSFLDWWKMFIHGRSLRTFSKCPLFNFIKTIDTDESIIHENAAGDFLCMHKDLWNKVGGYDEDIVGSGIMDGYIMWILYCFNVKQIILPYNLFHIYHSHTKGSSYIASWKKFREDTEKMKETKKPYKEVNQNYGFPQENFIEYIYTLK